ncbi:MAG: metal-dependent phosphohydrolase [Syntrophus sp. (in: bacteria)]|nr:metal-dependent phosphohydrolase [Syntrophus sp. (in: bacteria)]
MKTENKEHYEHAPDDQITRLLHEPAEHIRKFIESQLEKTKRLNMIGFALSAEKNLDRLLEMIVEEARKLTNADGGTLYILCDEEKELRFAVVQSETLHIRMGGTSGEITWRPVLLANADGSPNYSNVSAYAALSGRVVNIPDVYDAEGFSFEGTRAFDARTGYRSKSMLIVPMRNHENDIIGVLQLLNAQDTLTNEVTPFSDESQKMTESLASQAAVALTNNRLIHGLEDLLESLVKVIAAAIDEKSPYTGGHVKRVAELTMNIADKINATTEGTYSDRHFNEDEMKELRIAAWLHDVGKVTTPEYIVDKSTKLETICDRIELLKTRFEVLKRDREIELLKEWGSQGLSAGEGNGINGGDGLVKKLEEDLMFLTDANDGSKFMTDEMVERVNKIARMQWIEEGELKSALTDDEIRNICIRNGTLTFDEREIINKHAKVTYKMLSQMPFPKKLRYVPEYASAHHERPDGSGYPLGLKGDQISLQSRILALADIFEALTAKDRPYKKGKTLSEVIKIMKFMVKDNYIDSELFNLFIKEQIYLDYAREELAPQQIDLDKVEI